MMSFRTLIDWLKSGRSGASGKQGTRRARPRTVCSLFCETLEDRAVPAAVFSVADAHVFEGNDGTRHAEVVVSLSEPHAAKVNVNYSTVNGTATAGSDFNAVSGTLTFAKGETSKTILVPVRGDRIVEHDESFYVQLSNPTKGARIANSTATVHINDDEPRINISDTWAREGNDGPTAFVFTVSLSNEYYDRNVTVNWSTADGSAQAGIDYTADSGTLIFEPGQGSKTITVWVNGDRLPEQDKSFRVNLSTPDSYAEINRGSALGTIMDDEPRISISDAWNNDTNTLTFTVTLSNTYDQVVMVDFATVGGTAVAGIDYIAASETLTFEINETTQWITIELLDATSDWEKWLTVQLSNASSEALISNATATGYWYSDYYDPGYGYYYDYGYYDYGYYYY